MAFYSGVSSRAVCKPSSSATSSPTSSGTRLVRRRGRGSLVRSKACVWSKHELDRLHALSLRPRQLLLPDIIDVVVSPSKLEAAAAIHAPPASDSSCSTVPHLECASAPLLQLERASKQVASSPLSFSPAGASPPTCALLERVHARNGEHYEHDLRHCASQVRRSCGKVVGGEKDSCGTLQSPFVSVSKALLDTVVNADHHDSSSSCHRREEQHGACPSDDRAPLLRANVPSVTRITTSLVDLSI